MSLEILIGNLMAYEVQLEDRKKDEQQLQFKKKVLAFHSDLDNSDDDEEEMTMILGKFRKFQKQDKINPLCFKYNKPSHIKKDCPLLKYKRNFKTFNKFNKKKKDQQETWENSDSSSSNEEEATENVNVCFMTQEEDEVQYTELLDAFHELYNCLLYTSPSPRDS